MRGVFIFFWIAFFTWLSASHLHSRNEVSADTLIVQLSEKNEPFFERQIKAGQTLYSLSRSFQLSVSEVLALNPGLDSAALSIGTRVKVPLTTLNFKSINGGETPAGMPAWYRVRPGDNWFRISRIYFQGDTEAMERLNSHLPRGLQPGELVQVGWVLSSGETTQQVRAVNYRMPVNVSPDRMDKMRMYHTLYSSRVKTVAPKTRAGAAWIDESIGDDLMPDDVFVFMNGVPEQTIVCIKNPLTNRMIYARVLGPVRRLGVPEHVEIVVTSDVAAMLEAHNRRFFVEISWPAN